MTPVPPVANALEDVPGWELVGQGLHDLGEERVTEASCLASIARPWLERTGLLKHNSTMLFVEEPERALYRLLGAQGGDAFGRYNALLRRLVSFEHEIARRARRAGVFLNREIFPPL